MSYKIDLGVWGSVFAVPSAVVDKGLKLASDIHLKVLLYILRHSNHSITDELISQALGVHPDDVKDAIEYWIQKGILASKGELLTIPEDKTQSTSEVPDDTVFINNEVVSTKNTESPRPVSRAVKPEPSYVANRLKDESVAWLLTEASSALSKMLSRPDMATLIMLHDTDGLPVEVILMLIEHCVQIGKGNMRYIERTGIAWASDGVDTVSLADEKIKNYSASTSAWNTVAAVFGMRLSGTPTKKQLEFAARWLNEWLFSEAMLRLAYERCVDAKGEANLSYINAILKRWHEQSLKTTDDVIKYDELSASKRVKKSKKSDAENASYDLDEYENTSIFD